MVETLWWRYLQRLMGEQTQTEAASQIGITPANFSRWKDGARPAPDYVVKVARGYEANVLEALVEAEFITREEAELREVRGRDISLSMFSDRELAEELARRMARAEEGLA